MDTGSSALAVSPGSLAVKIWPFVSVGSAAKAQNGNKPDRPAQMSWLGRLPL